MKKLIFLLTVAFAFQGAKADDEIASYTFPDQDLVPSGNYTGTISETLGTVSGCSVYCYKIGGYQANGETPNSQVLNETTYFQKFSGDASYIIITLTGGERFKERDVFRATLYSGAASTDGFYFKVRTTGNVKTMKYSSTAAVTLEYQLKKEDINDDGSLTLYRYGGACYVNSITIERPSVVDYLSTNFNDGTWNPILSSNPTTGTFGSSVRNSFKYVNAVMRNGTITLSGPTALSDNDVKFTNRILVDKNTTSFVITPYVNNCKSLRIVANSGTADKSFNVYKQVGAGEWTSVATPQSSTTTPTLYCYDIDSNSPVRFRIENNTTSALFVPFIGTDPLTFPVSISSLGYATFSSAGQYQVPDGVKIYIINSSTSTSARLSEIDGNIIPAKTGVLLYKDGGGDIILESNSESATEVGTNLLKCNTVAQELSQTSDDYTNFILVRDGETNNVLFGKVDGTSTLAANRAYLQLPTSSLAGARELSITFDEGETTSISEELKVKSEEGSARRPEGESQFALTAAMYDLQGRRVAQPTKGLYIVNGKKYIVK